MKVVWTFYHTYTSSSDPERTNFDNSIGYQSKNLLFGTELKAFREMQKMLVKCS